MAKLVASDIYTFTELLALAKQGLAEMLARGKSYTSPDGVTWVSQDADKLQAHVQWLIGQADAETAGQGSVIMYAQVGR